MNSLKTSFRWQLGLLVLIFFDYQTIFAQPDPVEWCAHAKSRLMEMGSGSRDIPHPQQEDYSVVYYDLNLSINPTAKTIAGEVGIDVVIIADSTNQILLDLTSNFHVTKITSENENLGFNHTSNLIFIQLSHFYKSGELLNLRVHYNGAPATGAFNFGTRAGKPLIWTLSQPFGAKSWWPNKNYPEDKADSARIAITVPKDLVVGSNGTLTEQNESGDLTEYVWKVSYPIASYLISIAAHDYLIHKQQYYYGEADSMDVVHYIYRDHFDSEKSKYEITTEMLSVFTSMFGEYPFVEEKYGHAECPFNGGMEHQTLTSLLGPYESLIAHELAHQWWGDMITCKDYHHIWLNEGFATYTEALWAEFKYGTAAYHENMNSKQYFGDGTIYVPDLTFSGRIFDAGLSYRKGAWVLHMLRHIVGTENFFRILKAYGDGPKKYGVATTSNFQDVCETISGQDLTPFFFQWIYGEGFPVYAYDWSYTEENGKYLISLDIFQLQTGQLFNMPLDIHITTASGETLHVIQNSETFQQYYFESAEEPLSISLDKNNWVLKEMVLNHNFVNHNNGNMIFSVFNNGSLGFDQPNGQGNGLIYPQNGENLLYSGSFILGTQVDFVADNDIVTGAADLVAKNSEQNVFKNTPQEQLAKWIYNDSGHPAAAGIEIEQTTMSFKSTPDDEYVLMEYILKNKGLSELSDFYAGIILDLDIDYHLNNQVGKSISNQLIYQKNGIHVGICALEPKEKISLIAVSDPQQKFKEATKYYYLSGASDDFIAGKNDDWAIINAVGPLDLSPGDSVRLAFTLVAGSNEQALVQKTQLAKIKYDQIISSIEITDHENKLFLVTTPNPASNELEITYELSSAGDAHICLMDFSGKVLLNSLEKDKNPGFYNKKLDIQDFPPGVYIVLLKTNHGTAIKRWVKI